jgi:putative transposase
MNVIQRAYKTELALNNKQITACKRHAGAARWAYNWGLARKQEAYHTTGKSPTAIELHRDLNALKQTTIPGCARSLSAPHKKPCAIWTTPSRTSFVACS